MQSLATIVPGLEATGIDLLAVSDRATTIFWPWPTFFPFAFDCTSIGLVVIAAKVTQTLTKAGWFFWQKMLTLEPSRRVTARGALEHEYFKDVMHIP